MSDNNTECGCWVTAIMLCVGVGMGCALMSWSIGTECKHFGKSYLGGWSITCEAKK